MDQIWDVQPEETEEELQILGQVYQYLDHRIFFRALNYCVPQIVCFFLLIRFLKMRGKKL